MTRSIKDSNGVKFVTMCRKSIENVNVCDMAVGFERNFIHTWGSGTFVFKKCFTS